MHSYALSFRRTADRYPCEMSAVLSNPPIELPFGELDIAVSIRNQTYGNDQEDEASQYDLVHVLPLPAPVLCVDIGGLRMPTHGVGRIVRRLGWLQIRVSVLLEAAILSLAFTYDCGIHSVGSRDSSQLSAGQDRVGRPHDSYYSSCASPWVHSKRKRASTQGRLVSPAHEMAPRPNADCCNPRSQGA